MWIYETDTRNIRIYFVAIVHSPNATAATTTTSTTTTTTATSHDLHYSLEFYALIFSMFSAYGSMASKSNRRTACSTQTFAVNTTYTHKPTPIDSN